MPDDSFFLSPQFANLHNFTDVIVSMDGKGRALDNVFVERLWRSVKYEEIYPKGYESTKEVRQKQGTRACDTIEE